MNTNRHLSRRSDVETSALAASTLELDLSERHERVLAELHSICPATDLEMAQALSELGHGREESCRRVVRTLREEHGRLVAAIDAETGDQIRHLNSTGRWADCWQPGDGIPSAPRTPTDSIAARVARAVHVEIDCVEHVRLDGANIYLASDLLERLMAFADTDPQSEPEEWAYDGQGEMF